ncbi:Fructosamine kinase-domain-containing protein [Podospora australis]|uniref:protein-ribulosamine 3-kinase n=1 Tax=Podospora australis TaxID=1536484 RepID=A0AAN6WS13_9PEZI|nr:Fructosamine kinase-domain-containing protein [Podospora australis]
MANSEFSIALPVFKGDNDAASFVQSEEDGSDPYSIKSMLSRPKGVFPFDEAAVMKVLPQGSKFLSVESFAKRAHTITGKVMALDPMEGEKHISSRLVAFGEYGRTMLNGEAESSKIIYELMPDFIPQPFRFGEYSIASPATYFYISKSVDMDITTAPDPVDWGQRLANLHKKSQSSTGKFGFPVITCDGRTAHIVEWEDSWAQFYRKLFLNVCKLDKEVNETWPQLDRAVGHVANVIIPRLLGNLCTKEGKPIKPCIIHGDLWEGNMGINLETGKYILFDAGSLFAHNEMKLGHWRCEFTTVFRQKVYWDAYLENYPAAEPAEEFDDRNRLYSLKGAINYSVGHPRSQLRKTAYNNMLYLIEKYAPIDGLSRYDPEIDPEITGACLVPHESET